MNDPVEQVRAALADAEEALGRFEDERDAAHDAGFKEGEESGEAEGRREVDQLVHALIDDVDRRRRQAQLPLPLNSGVMTLDQVEAMIRRVSKG